VGFKHIHKGFDTTSGIYVTEAYHPNKDQMLGFIEYSERTGVIEFANFGAILTPSSLALGFSTKANKDHLAGGHGEGFKLATLVMLRTGYAVNIAASGFYWNFRWGGTNRKQLYCWFSDITVSELRNQKHAYQKKVDRNLPRERKANIWEDVSVKIGNVHGKSEKIKKEDFLEWKKVSIDLDSPSRMIKTYCGSLILDESFKNKIFLKGLLLPRKDNEGALFKFSYDFLTGKINRDRERLGSAWQEAHLLARIWDCAIETEQEILPEYIEMLQDIHYAWADVSLAKEHISRRTALRIWQFYLDQDPERKCFYYGGNDSDIDIEIIQKSLKKEPVRLADPVWAPLRKYRLVHTPQEQQDHLLKNAPDCVKEDSVYAAQVKRSLRAMLDLDPGTSGLTLRFKCGTEEGLDLLLDESDLLIHEKWLDFRSSHRSTPCSLFTSATKKGINVESFSCNHVVTHLYDLLLTELKKGSGRRVDSKSQSLTRPEDSLRVTVRENLDQMPRLVKVSTAEPGELKVTWTDLDGDRVSRLYGLEPQFGVVLHLQSTCSEKRHELLRCDGKLSRDPIS
jgi:hypothetical protein